MAYEIEEKEGILHVCGGDPEKSKNISKKVLYSPRVWR